MRRDVATRRARRLLRAQTWVEGARFVGWETLGSRSNVPSSPLSWAIDAEELEATSIRWPRRYAWANANHFIEPIRLALNRHLRFVAADIPQDVGNFVAFEVVQSDRTLRIGIDYDDLPVLHPDATRVDLCFKLQFQQGGYPSASIIPGGYVAPKLSIYRHAHRWRSIQEQLDGESPIFARFSPNSDIRRELLKIIDRAGWATEHIVVGSSWLAYMRELSQAPVCLDAPGRGEHCFRLVEGLAAGACLMGPELSAELHVPTGDAVMRVRRDLSDLVETCEKLLQNPEARSELRRRAADYFDRFLDLPQLGAYYVRSILDA